MPIRVQDRKLKKQRLIGLAQFECSYPGPSDLQCVVRIGLAFVGVAAHIAQVLPVHASSTGEQTHCSAGAKVSDKEREKLSAEIARLESLDLEQLRSRWKLLYETEAPPHLSRDLLMQAVAYRMQENVPRRAESKANIFSPAPSQAPYFPKVKGTGSLPPEDRLPKRFLGESCVALVV